MEKDSIVSSLKEAYGLELQEIDIKNVLFPAKASVVKICSDRSFWEEIQSAFGFNATKMSRVYMDLCPENIEGGDGLTPSDWLELPFVKHLLHCTETSDRVETCGYRLETVQDNQLQIWMSPDLFRLFAGWLDPVFSDAVEKFRLTRIWKTFHFAERDPVQRKQYVYLIGSKCEQVMKIGISGNVNSRLQSLQASNALDLDLLFCVEGDSKLEAKMLAKFSHLKIRGEWFSWDKRIISHFKLLKREQANA